MAKLVFQGHETRGKELHKLLEYLGGVDAGYEKCSCVTCFYYINREGYIEGSNMIPNYMNHRIIMSLETFESKYPYKVGDKVNYVKYNDRYPSVYTIQGMRWTGATIEYLLDSSGFSALTKDLQPYKEETMDKVNKTVFDTNAQCCDITNNLIKNETMEEIKLDIPDGYEFFGINDDNKVVLTKKKPQYPKTFIECAKILDVFCAAYIDGYKWELLENLQELLICRNAYWKIAGEQMGLGKHWKPDMSNDKFSYAISYQYGHIQKNEIRYKNTILAFPTEEIRDAFYENFKELIEECKELL